MLEALLLVGALLIGYFCFCALRPRDKSLPPLLGTTPYIGVGLAWMKAPMETLLQGAALGKVWTMATMGKQFNVIFDRESLSLFYNQPEAKVSLLSKPFQYMMGEEMFEIAMGRAPNSNVGYAKWIRRWQHHFSSALSGNMAEFIEVMRDESVSSIEAWQAEDGVDDLFQKLDVWNNRLTARFVLGGPLSRDKQLYVEYANFLIRVRAIFNPLASFKYEKIPTAANIAIRDARDNLLAMFVSEIKSIRRAKQADYSSLLAKFTKESPEGVGDRQLAVMCLAIMLASTFNSAAATFWTVSHILDDPKLLSEVRKEVDSVFPVYDQEQSGAETQAKYGELALIEACVKEVTRVYAPHFHLGRGASQDLHVLGFTVPKGQFLGSPVALIHGLDSPVNDAIYTNPQTYDPYRFLERNEGSEEYAFLGFGAGRHRCIGERFAYNKVKTFVVALLKTTQPSLKTGKVDKQHTLQMGVSHPNYTTPCGLTIKPK